MNRQIRHIRRLLIETYEGNAWHGRSIKDLLSTIPPETGLMKPNGKTHSIAELLYHMVNWKEFAISRLLPEDLNQLDYFEKNDWRELDLTNTGTWEDALKALDNTQQQLVDLLDELDDTVLDQPVRERNYKTKILLYGIVQHDIYHAGQIAYIKNLLT